MASDHKVEVRFLPGAPMTELQTCKHLDATGQVLCRFEGRYKTTRGKPTLADRAASDVKANGVVLIGMPILVCRPAAVLNASEKDRKNIEWLIEQQSQCSRYPLPLDTPKAR